MTELNPDIWISVASQLPLVIAFVYFSLKIISIYQGAQTKLIDQHQSSVETDSQRHSTMIQAIVGTWAAGCDKRDLEMKNFLTSITESNKIVNEKLAADLRDNTAALQSLQVAITNLQIQVGIGTNPPPNQNPPTRPVRSRQPRTSE